MASFNTSVKYTKMNSFPELMITNGVHQTKKRNPLQKQNSLQKIEIKSQTRIPAESPAQIYKEAYQLANNNENSKALVNQRGFSTPKQLKSIVCPVIPEKLTKSNVSSINKNHPQRKMVRHSTLKIEEPKSDTSKKNPVFSSFSDFCESNNLKNTNSDDTQSQATSDTGESNDSNNTSQMNSQIKEHAKPISLARLKSFKDINDAHNRHIEQKEFLLLKYKGLSENQGAELNNKNELIASQNKLIQSLQHSVQMLTEQLCDQEKNVQVTLKQYSVLRNEINEQRKESPEYQTLLDENIFIKQQSNRYLQAQKAAESQLADYKKMLSNIINWPAIAAIQNHIPQNYEEFIISKLSDYQQRRDENIELNQQCNEYKQKLTVMKEDLLRMEQERRILKATIEMQESRIDSIRDNDGYSKVFKQLTGVSMESIENDLAALKQLIMERRALNNDQISEEDKGNLVNIEYLKMQIENLKGNQIQTHNHLVSVEKKLKDQFVNVSKYKFIEELDSMEHHARKALQCNRCNSALFSSITHTPCGHSFCTDCFEERKQKIELNDQIPFDLKQSRICACCICGQDKKGNTVFRNQQMDQLVGFFNKLVQHKDMVKLLVSKY